MNTTQTVLVDARVVEAHCHHGIARYTYELIAHLCEQLPEGLRLYVVLPSQSALISILANRPNVQVVVNNSSWKSVWGQWVLQRLIAKLKPDLVHVPGPFVPLICRSKLVVTLHDANHVACEENYGWRQRLYYAWLGAHLKKTPIITVSHFSKEQLCRYLQLPLQNIHVIYNGISHEFQPKEHYDAAHWEKTRQQYGLPKEFIFTVGNQKPHKNIGTFLEAYRISGCRYPLVVLGYQQQPRADDTILFLPPHILPAQLAQIYAHCRLFVFPSLYEGFGFPPLEACATGVPVLASQAPCLPEILQEQAFYCNAQTTGPMAQALGEVLKRTENEDPQVRQARINHARTFMWEETAQKTLLLYQQLLEK